MAKDNISPEERLLNVIEKGEGASSHKTETNQIFFDLKSLFFNLKEWFLSMGGRGSGGMTRVLEADFLYNIRLINRVLTGIVGSLIIIFIADTIISRRDINKLYASASNLGAWQFQKKPVTPLKEFSFYEEAAKMRDLFNPAAEDIAEASTGTKKSKLQELAKDLRLVGIYWGDNPEAMVEDTEAKKTYFLKAGDEIKGIKIKEILQDRVVFQYDGEEMEFM